MKEKPFDASLFVEIRKRLGMDVINAMNEKIASLKMQKDRDRERETLHPKRRMIMEFRPRMRRHPEQRKSLPATKVGY